MPAAITPQYHYHYETQNQHQHQHPTGKRTVAVSAPENVPQTQRNNALLRTAATAADVQLDALAQLAMLGFGQLVGLSAARPFLLYSRRLLGVCGGARQALLTLLAAMLFVRRFSRAKTLAAAGGATPGLEFRLLTVSLMLAFKMLEDNVLVRSKEWVQVCGKMHLDVAQLQDMEREFLVAIDYNVITLPSELKFLVSSLAALVHDHHGSNRQDSNSTSVSRAAIELLNQICTELDIEH